ncbi:hypothetical protein [Nitrosopumilus sp.]|uniref:hypothetical protein n=1 Tax=Nitrosopumilus sp. TaxID=2024843 RepID=UPI00262AD2D3|nr:hypothetical protein [Nitrosopumilus sp.]
MLTNYDRSVAVSRLCMDILASNERVYFVSSLNKNGRVTEAQFRDDRIISKMSKQESEMLFMQRTLQTSLGKEFDDLIGPLDSITLQRETVFEFLFPYSDGILFVISDLEIIPSYFTKKISFMLRDHDWKSVNTICE